MRQRGVLNDKDPAEIIKAAINSAFVKYHREDDPHWSNTGFGQKSALTLLT